MMPPRPFAVALLCAWCALATAADDPPKTPVEEPADQRSLPKIDDLPTPSAAELLKGRPIDWIVLFTNRVLKVEPLQPRPGALEALEARYKAMFKGAGSDTDRGQREAAAMLNLVLVDVGEDEWRDYKLHLKWIKQIIYYEDLVLRRIDKLLTEGDTEQAFDLLTLLERRNPDWPGAKAARERYLAVEALAQVQRRELESALATTEELHRQNADHEQLDKVFSAALEALMSEADAASDGRRARYFLERVRVNAPNNRTVKQWTDKLQSRASESLQKGLAAETAGDFEGALAHMERATLLWPRTTDLVESYRRVSARFQRLPVGVLKLPGREAREPTIADQRVRSLLRPPLFEPALFDGKAVRYRSRFFEEWEPTDLGRSLLFRLKTRRAAWDPVPPVLASSLADQLLRRLDPGSPQFDERFANLVTQVRPNGPFELSVDFSRGPLRPEALFPFPVQLVSDDAASLADAGPFILGTLDTDEAVFRRSSAEPGSIELHLAEIIEKRYESEEKAVQALLRGEVWLLPHVSPATASSLEGHRDFTVREYAVPVVHALQFHPRNEALANRALRRALVFALDRPRILDETVLRASAGKGGRLTTSLLPTTSPAYNAQVPHHKHDPRLARSMLLAARKELKGSVPPLRLRHPVDPTIAAAANEIASEWRQIGLEIALEASDDPSPDTKEGQPAWDILYHPVSMIDPVVELWPSLTLDPAASVASLTHYPHWLRQELLALDRAGDWASAEAILHLLHKHLWAEVQFIPLWEVSDSMILRKQLVGIPPRPMQTYQDVERWRMQPWYPRETPQ
jgi:hypothetical protein